MVEYFDPIYGKIELDDAIVDLVSRCPELKRLNYVGLMNYRSWKVLSLTNTTRLEHSIGLAYASQLFIKSNPSLENLYYDLIVASLYHDINCGAFGHSVEWAIDRYTAFSHESEASWVKEKDSLSCLSNKPVFIEQDGLHRFKFKEKYNLKFKLIEDLIDGKSIIYINSKGIDLDNIDNVFRMAHYLGLLNDLNLPSSLIRSLKVHDGYDNFIINKSDISLIENWYSLRSAVYEKFIYSHEYMVFEYLVFKLISEYAKTLDSVDDLKSLFHLTDERLLWTCYEMKSSNPTIAKIARRILLQDTPMCYSILRSDSIVDQNSLIDNEALDNAANRIQEQLSRSGINTQINLHLTTDNRKTHRLIEFYIKKGETICEHHIGDDRSFILIAIIGEEGLSEKSRVSVGRTAIDVLAKEGFLGFSIYNNIPMSEQLSLF